MAKTSVKVSSIDSVVIRQVHSDELHKVTQLIHEHAEFERAEVPKFKLENLKDVLLLDNCPITIFVAVLDNKTVGYLSATTDFSTWNLAYFMHMDCLYVQSEYRNRNIGQKLMMRLFEECQRRQIDSVQWQTPDWNSKATKFYERMGAKSMSKTCFHYTL